MTSEQVLDKKQEDEDEHIDEDIVFSFRSHTRSVNTGT